MDPQISDLVSDITEMMQESAIDAGMDADLPDEIDIQAIVAGEIEDAVDYIDSVISPDRALATQYYRGEPFGNEEEGRSQVVSRDVRDTVQAILPSLMRMFFGGNNIVEFAPNGPEDVRLKTLIPAYVTSELKTAFQIGFLVFLPFLIVDMVVASVLMSMGMMMVSPVIISLPFKLILFVLVDGWTLLIASLVQSFYVLKVVGGVLVGPKERVVVVEFGDSWPLLGVTAGQVSLLHSLPRPGNADTQMAASSPQFADWLKQFLQKSRQSNHNQG